MAQTLEICFENDGTISVTTGEKEEVPEMEAQEGGNKQVFKSAEEAKAAIGQMVDAAAGIQAPAPEAPEGDQVPMEDTQAQEEQSMVEGYRGR